MVEFFELVAYLASIAWVMLAFVSIGVSLFLAVEEKRYNDACLVLAAGVFAPVTLLVAIAFGVLLAPSAIRSLMSKKVDQPSGEEMGRVRL